MEEVSESSVRFGWATLWTEVWDKEIGEWNRFWRIGNRRPDLVGVVSDGTDGEGINFQRESNEGRHPTRIYKGFDEEQFVKIPGSHLDFL